MLLKGEFNYSLLTFDPLRFAALRCASCPPEGAREDEDARLPAPKPGEGCPKDRKGASSNNTDLCKKTSYFSLDNRPPVLAFVERIDDAVRSFPAYNVHTAYAFFYGSC